MGSVTSIRDIKPLFRRASEILAMVVFLTGVTVLMGWYFRIEVFKSVLPGIVTMKANTALCFLLAGIGLFGIQEKRANSPFSRISVAIVSSAIFMIGSFTLCEYLMGIDLHIDQALFKEPSGAVMTAAPGRMAVNSAICFIMVGAALFLACSAERIRRVVSQLLFLLSGAVAFLALLGYVYGVSAFYSGIARYTAMAIHTTLAFIFIALSGIFARPESGIMKPLSSGGITGAMTRRLVVLIAVISLTTDALVHIGVSRGLYNDTFAQALHADLLMTVLCFIVMISGYRMLRGEEIKESYEKALKEQEERYRIIYFSSPDAIMVLDPGKRFLGGNPAAVKMFGCADEAVFNTKTPAELSPEIQPDGARSSEKAALMEAAAMANGSHLFEWKHKSPDRGEFWSSVLLSRITIAGETVLLATVRDISAHKSQESELQKKMWDLERFYKATMDREKRVLELRDEVKKLRERLGEGKV